MRAEIDQIVDWCREAVGLVIKLHETNPDFYANFGESPANMMGLVDERGALDFYHGGLRARDADGAPIFDHVDYATYKTVLQEDVKNLELHEVSRTSRRSAPTAAGIASGRWRGYRSAISCRQPHAEAERLTFLKAGGGKPAHGALMYHWARMIEMLHAAELARELLDDPDIIGADLMADKGPRRRKRSASSRRRAARCSITTASTRTTSSPTAT